MTHFPISGVETYWWLPIVVAFIVSVFTSTGGLSGAFVLLPFQVSVLRFTGPAVSPTNLIFNIVAIPSGVWRYHREGRIVWPLAWVIIAGTLPGVFLGAFIRISYLPDPQAFKLFAGLVLLYIGVRLGSSLFKNARAVERMGQGEKFMVTEPHVSMKRISYVFNEHDYSASTPGLFVLSLIVGIIGGTYGIGGGAIIAPFLVAVFGLPVYTIAGAALLSTLITSVAGVIYYVVLAPFYAHTGLDIYPDWQLGLMFGIGGAAGMYIGARLQRFMPAFWIKLILTVCLLFIAVKYVVGFFW